MRRIRYVTTAALITFVLVTQSWAGQVGDALPPAGEGRAEAADPLSCDLGNLEEGLRLIQSSCTPTESALAIRMFGVMLAQMPRTVETRDAVVANRCYSPRLEFGTGVLAEIALNVGLDRTVRLAAVVTLAQLLPQAAEHAAPRLATIASGCTDAVIQRAAFNTLVTRGNGLIDLIVEDNAVLASLPTVNLLKAKTLLGQVIVEARPTGLRVIAQKALLAFEADQPVDLDQLALEFGYLYYGNVNLQLPEDAQTPTVLRTIIAAVQTGNVALGMQPPRKPLGEIDTLDKIANNPGLQLSERILAQTAASEFKNSQQVDLFKLAFSAAPLFLGTGSGDADEVSAERALVANVFAAINDANAVFESAVAVEESLVASRAALRVIVAELSRLITASDPLIRLAARDAVFWFKTERKVRTTGPLRSSGVAAASEVGVAAASLIPTAAGATQPRATDAATVSIRRAPLPEELEGGANRGELDGGANRIQVEPDPEFNEMVVPGAVRAPGGVGIEFVPADVPGPDSQ